jgi:hypothetical protein
MDKKKLTLNRQMIRQLRTAVVKEEDLKEVHGGFVVVGVPCPAGTPSYATPAVGNY